MEHDLNDKNVEWIRDIKGEAGEGASTFYPFKSVHKWQANLIYLLPRLYSDRLAMNCAV